MGVTALLQEFAACAHAGAELSFPGVGIYSIASRLGTNRITFEPYTHHQLIEILTARLRGVLGSHSVRAHTLE